MIRKSEERSSTIRENLFGGEGAVKMQHLLNASEEMLGKGRLFAHFILEPGCSIGYHVHEGEAETYYFLRGIGEVNDNGELKTVHPGDVAHTNDGEGHGLKNIGDEPLEFVALILFK